LDWIEQQAILAGIKADLLDLVLRVQTMEFSLQSTAETIENKLDINTTTGPLMFDGVFNLNEKNENTSIFSMKNDSNQTIHFTPENIGVFDKPYIFGRLLTIDGKKLEGRFEISVVKSEEIESVVLQASTEKVNFSHPTKHAQKLFIDLSSHTVCEPGETIQIRLKSKEILDPSQSKIVIEDLVFAEVAQ